MSASAQPGEKLALTEIASYQPGAIVSRVLLRKDAGSITLFAFDQGQELSEHTAPFDAWLYVTEGEAEVRIEGTPHHLRGGEMIVLPAHRPHAVKALARFKMVLAMIRA